jgi:hypothetical protein
MTKATNQNSDAQELELRKVKALEKIAASLDALTIWFEEIDKDEWSNRVQYYLSEFHNKIVKDVVFDAGKEIKVPTTKNGKK